ncbi:MAG: metallopeptidase family protein [Eubacteriales bacterium]|nr:metallopeptidase family protein [Eubacteriales bacterium]
MISIDRFEEILGALAEELPEAFYEELNGGILVDPGRPLHPADEHGDLYIMGEYRVEPAMGKYIVMFYGSFRRVFGNLDEARLTEEMRKVLRHEFRHHVEGRAGVRDLEVWDEEQISAYRARQEN